AVNATHKIKSHAIRVLCLAIVTGIVFSTLPTKDINRFLDLFVSYSHLSARHFQLFKRRNFDFRVDFECHAKGQLFFIRIVRTGFKAWCPGYAQTRFLNHAFKPTADFGIDDVVADTATMTTLDDRKRRLPGAKALD